MRRQLLAIVLGAVVATPVVASRDAWAQKSPMAQAAFARAQTHLASARFVEAANEMDTAVRYEPRFALGWYVLASTSRRAGQCDRAVAAYRRYMELRPVDPDPYFGAALCLQSVGDREGALTAFRHYVETDTRPASREFVAAARRHLSELERSLENAAATGPVRPPSPVMLEARQLRDHDRTDEAVARYRVEITANPKSAEPHVELGTLLVSARRFKEAVDELRAALRLAPDSATAWYNLAFALRETDQATEAVDAYRRYITFKPKDADPHYGLGRALAILGREDEALVAFRTYVTLETRATEKRWVKKARVEIARIESAHRPQMAADPSRPPGASNPVHPAGTSPPAMVPAAKAKPTVASPAKGQSGARSETTPSAPAVQAPAAREP